MWRIRIQNLRHFHRDPVFSSRNGSVVKNNKQGIHTDVRPHNNRDQDNNDSLWGHAMRESDLGLWADWLQSLDQVAELPPPPDTSDSSPVTQHDLETYYRPLHYRGWHFRSKHFAVNRHGEQLFIPPKDDRGKFAFAAPFLTTTFYMPEQERRVQFCRVLMGLFLPRNPIGTRLSFHSHDVLHVGTSTFSSISGPAVTLQDIGLAVEIEQVYSEQYVPFLCGVRPRPVGKSFIPTANHLQQMCGPLRSRTAVEASTSTRIHLPNVKSLPRRFPPLRQPHQFAPFEDASFLGSLQPIFTRGWQLHTSDHRLHFLRADGILASIVYPVRSLRKVLTFTRDTDHLLPFCHDLLDLISTFQSCQVTKFSLANHGLQIEFFSYPLFKGDSRQIHSSVTPQDIQRVIAFEHMFFKYARVASVYRISPAHRG